MQLSVVERQQLAQWNDTTIAYPHDRCIHQLIEAKVETSPDAIAVVFEDQSLTYGQLNHRANQLAHHLIALGVQPEQLIGICVERSLEMIVGILGILKAGAAYLPLDPTYPSERLAFMLQDAAVSILLTQQTLTSVLPENDAKLVCLDADWEQIAQQSHETPVSHVTPTNLAYVIYTSGSTGKPKGVLLEHRGLCNLAQAQIHQFKVTASSCVLQFASISFDASVWEIVMALVAGARLCLGSREHLLPGIQLISLIEKQQVTHVTLPPTALAALPEASLPTLQTIIVAGEACPPSLAHRWASGRQFFNAYGPTETTVCATIVQYEPGMTALPIGRPIANTQVYILDHQLQPVSIGVAGELHIGGAGLARGYLNRPDLTQAKFIPNPFSTELGSRLYKTGDLARYLPDGNIEFLGRIDHQVKIRGYRIELQEVEAVLMTYPLVKQTVVVAREDQPGHQRLVAYLVPHSEQSLMTTELRRFLQDQLPDYAIPSAFVMLEVMPQTPNGKIDRKALPAPPSQRPSLEQDYVAPRTEQEHLLSSIWANILGLDQVGIYDNFYELGGNSLLSAQVVTQIQRTLNIDLSVVKLFQHPTIAEFATYLSQQQNDGLTQTSQINDSQGRYNDRAQRQKAQFEQRKQSRGKR